MCSVLNSPTGQKYDDERTGESFAEAYKKYATGGGKRNTASCRLTVSSQSRAWVVYAVLILGKFREEFAFPLYL